MPTPTCASVDTAAAAPNLPSMPTTKRARGSRHVSSIGSEAQLSAKELSVSALRIPECLRQCDDGVGGVDKDFDCESNKAFESHRSGLSDFEEDGMYEEEHGHTTSKKCGPLSLSFDDGVTCLNSILDTGPTPMLVG